MVSDDNLHPYAVFCVLMMVFLFGKGAPGGVGFVLAIITIHRVIY